MHTKTLMADERAPTDGKAVGKAVPPIPFLQLTLGPRGSRAVRGIASVTGLQHDDVASHLLEHALNAPHRIPVLLGRQASGAPSDGEARLRLTVGLTTIANDRLLRAARQSHLTEQELASVYLEHMKLGLTVFTEACRAQRALHQHVLRGLPLDISAAIRAAQLQRSLATERKLR